MKLSEKLVAVAEWLKDEENDLLVSAEEKDQVYKMAQANPIKHYVDALLEAMRGYTGTDLTPGMNELSNKLATFDSFSATPDYDTLENIALAVGSQPWRSDPAINKAATELWQAAENGKKQVAGGLAVGASQERSALVIVAEALVLAADAIAKAAEEMAVIEPETITPEALDELAAVAESFDASDDELLQKQASVLDDLLVMLAASKSVVAMAKKSEDDRIEQLKKKYREPKEIDDKRNHISEAVKEIEKAPIYKQTRPLETPLSTRVCIEHAGTPLQRVGEEQYQCPLDKKIYNYAEGYTLLNGTKVPGTSVSNQTQDLWNNTGDVIFDTRSDKTGMNRE